jgi:hypothetical protein
VKLLKQPARSLRRLPIRGLSPSAALEKHAGCGGLAFLAGLDDLTAAQIEGLLREEVLPGEWPLGFGEGAVNGGGFGPHFPSGASLRTGRLFTKSSSPLPKRKQEHTPRARSSEILPKLMTGVPAQIRKRGRPAHPERRCALRSARPVVLRVAFPRPARYNHQTGATAAGAGRPSPGRAFVAAVRDATGSARLRRGYPGKRAVFRGAHFGGALE